MDFEVKRRGAPIKTQDIQGQEEIDIAYKFSKVVYKEFGHFLKAIVLFGSRARQTNVDEKGDIDILLVVDDVTFYITPEIIETYKIVLENTILNVSKRIHVTTLKFTTFWEYIRICDPIGINMLRDGVALIDTGFFTPLQMLLFQGRIRPTEEAIIAYMAKSPQTLHNSRWHVIQATLDLYWSIIDAAHAALMKEGVIPPTPEKVADALEEHLVKKGKINKRCVPIMKKFYKLSKQILHKEIKDINGKNYEFYYNDAKFFYDEIKKYLK